MNNDTTAEAMQLKPCRYCGDQKRFQIVSPVSDHAWADCFCVKARTTSLAAQDGLVELLQRCLKAEFQDRWPAIFGPLRDDIEDALSAIRENKS